MTVLAGKRVLILEDEPLIAMMAADMLMRLGASVVGPVASLEEAERLAETGAFDAALLDLNIDGQMSSDLVERLVGRALPVVVATGYGKRAESLAERALPVVSKPYTLERIEAAFAAALKT